MGKFAKWIAGGLGWALHWARCWMQGEKKSCSKQEPEGRPKAISK